MRRFLFAILPWVWLLAGCQTTAQVPLPVSCAAMVAALDAPDTPDAIKAAPNIQARVRLLLAGRKLRDGKISELQDALAACDLPNF